MTRRKTKRQREKYKEKTTKRQREEDQEKKTKRKKQRQWDKERPTLFSLVGHCQLQHCQDSRDVHCKDRQRREIEKVPVIMRKRLKALALEPTNRQMSAQVMIWKDVTSWLVVKQRSFKATVRPLTAKNDFSEVHQHGQQRRWIWL